MTTAAEVLRAAAVVLGVLLIVSLADRQVHTRDRTDGTYVLGMVVLVVGTTAGAAQGLRDGVPLRWATPIIPAGLLLLLIATRMSRRRR